MLKGNWFSRKKILCTFVLVVFHQLSLAGGNLSVTPMKTTLSKNNPIDTIQLANNGNDLYNFQITQIDSWQQVSGKDVYHKSADIIAVPPIANVKPHTTQTIRVGYRGSWDVPQEKAYRIKIQQLNTVVQKMDGSNTSLGIKLNIMFVVYIKPNVLSNLLAEGSAKTVGTQLQLHVHNPNNHHIKVVKYAINNSAGKTLTSGAIDWPILAGATRNRAIDIQGVHLKPGSYQLMLTQEDSKQITMAVMVKG